MVGGSSEYRISIQYLRAVAAIMVVIFHCYQSVPFMRPNLEGLGWLRSGVDIFFVISGYVMVVSTQGRELSPSQFLGRRIQRIVPIYWIATGAMIVAGLAADWVQAVTSLFFIPHLHPVEGWYQPLVLPGWTLNYEMFFYALFALSLILREQFRLATMAVALGGLAVAGALFSPSGIAGFYSDPVIVEFLLGMAIARFRPKAHWLLLPLGFVALILFDGHGHRLFTYGIAAAAIVAGALSLEQKLPHWHLPALLGDASYSIYIFHFMLIGAFVKIWQIDGVDNAWFAPLALLFVLPIGLLIHLALEKPLGEALRNGGWSRAFPFSRAGTLRRR